jgi:serine/threonine protein kinase/formylglycine-generating enzyme required for sulfatase activity
MRECQVCKQCYPDAVTNCPQDSQPTFHSIAGNPILEGKYRLEKRLGQGGMGVVYSARHSYLKTQLAIKVILPDLVGNDPQLVTRFRQEALAAAAIRHHNVVQVTDYGVVDDKMPFLVMEYVEGESLHDMLAREKRLGPEKAVELMAAICAGVGAAHKQGIVHRDLKPLNVMILKDKAQLSEAVKILDFGLAKIKSGELLGSFIQAQTTGLMGSPYYMAPEQWADEEPDAQADIYSLGVMLFQMMAGDVPFKGSSIPAIMQKHLNNPPPTFKEVGVDIPPMVEQAVRHSLEKDRHKRTQSVQDFVEELRRSIGLGNQSLPTAGLTGALPVSAIHILTTPPQAKVFMDNMAVGESQPDGYLLLEGIQSGNHRIRISKPGFHDWENQIVCDGKPQQVIAQLQHTSGTIDPAKTILVGHNSTHNQPFPQTQGAQTQLYTGENQQNPQMLQGSQVGFQPSGQVSQMGGQVSQMGMQGSQVNWQQTGQQSFPGTEQQQRGFSPLIWGITGIFALLLLTGLGVGGGYMLGLFGTTGPTATPTVGSSPAASTTPVITSKNEMVQIPGGRFRMGSNSGPENEQPAHEVEVQPFWMDKTEVTNAEYHEFVKATNHRAPTGWAEGRPVPGKEMLPVVFVSMENIEKFIEWRSKRDNVRYRLPTEQEWEFAARNGEDSSLYPWGNDPAITNAVIEQASAIAVGSIPSGANKWGVLDLIGNVWEWTATEASLYPGNSGTVAKTKVPTYMIRGGSYNSRLSGERSVTATTRIAVDTTRQDGLLGFRLVKDK